MKNRPPTKPDPWLLGEDIPDIDFASSQIWLSCFVNEFKSPGGRAYRKILAVYRGYHLWFYYGERDSAEVGQHLITKFARDPSFTRRVNQAIIRWSNKLRAFAETLPETGLEKLSSRKLWELYSAHDRLHSQYYQWGWIPVAADMFHSNFTECLKERLKQRGLAEDKVNEAFVTLTQPTRPSLIQVERRAWLELALRIQRDPSQRRVFISLFDQFKEQADIKFGLATHTPEYEAALEKQSAELVSRIRPSLLKAVQAHYAKYFFVQRMWVGRVATFEHYLKELVKLVGHRSDIRQMLIDDRRTLQAGIRKRQQLLRRWGIRGQDRTLFDSFGDFMVTKIYRRFAQIYALYKLEFIQREIGRRLKLTLIQVRFMLPDEVRRALATGKADRRALRERSRFCVYQAERGNDSVFTGTRAKSLAQAAQSVPVSQANELRGQTGCVGQAVGTVRIVIRPKDMAKMRPGDVLVSIATDPDIVPAMKKAAAIVTEQGGVTSHAAIVSRELNIPCVIGTKIATKVFKDGDRIEVDATKGIVRRV